MKAASRIYLAAVVLFTVGVYSLVLGDVGYIRRNMMKKEVLEMENKVGLLRSENKYLTEQYLLLKENPNRNKKTGKHALKRNIVILKFEETEQKKSELVRFFSDHENSLEETRIFFLAAMVFIGFCGSFLLHRIKKTKKAGMQTSL